MAAVGFRARQHEFRRWSKRALAVGKISGKKDASFASPAMNSEIPPFINRARVP